MLEITTRLSRCLSCLRKFVKAALQKSARRREAPKTSFTASPRERREDPQLQSFALAASELHRKARARNFGASPADAKTRSFGASPRRRKDAKLRGSPRRRDSSVFPMSSQLRVMGDHIKSRESGQSAVAKHDCPCERFGVHTKLTGAGHCQVAGGEPCWLGEPFGLTSAS